MINENVRQLVDDALASGHLDKSADIYVIAQKITDILTKDCFELCINDYKNQGNYGAGYRLAHEIKSKYSS